MSERREENRLCGFTLVELMVVLAIIITITGVVLNNQSAFNKTLILANTAYDVALSIRDAQTYGLASRTVGAATNAGYGIDFSKTTPNTFTLFADIYPLAGSAAACHPAADPSAPSAQPGDCVYESGQSEMVTGYTLGNNITVTDLCAFSSGSWKCSSSHGSTVSSLDIVFARPNADAFISVNGAYSSLSPVTAACITLSSAQGGTRFVSIAASGAVTANAVSCP